MKKWIVAVSVLLVLLAGGVGAYLLIPADPEYCWLVFGPEAKIRVLVRLQGRKVYVNRGGKDELAGRQGADFYGQRYFTVENLLIDDPDKQTTYTITDITRFDDPHSPFLWVDVHVRGSLDYRQYGNVYLTASPDNAKEAHFHGPLTVDLSPKAPWTLRRGDKPTKLRVKIGTIDAEKGCWVVVTTLLGKDRPAFPVGVHPVVDVEYPAKDQGPPIERRYALDEPC